MEEKMKKALEETLLDGEKVLWESGTQPFRLIDGREGRRTLIQWILSTAICATFLVLRMTQGAFTGKVLAVVLVLYAVLMLSPVISYRGLLAQRYYVTNERAILIKRDASVYTMKINDGDIPAKIFPVKPGAAISIGAAIVEEGDKQLRWRSLNPLENPGKFDGCNASGLVFYNVARAEDVLWLLRGGTEKEA